MPSVRGHHEGSVSHYHDGRIVVRVTMRDGSRRSLSTSADHERGDCETRDRRQAKPLLARLELQRDAGAVGRDWTLGRFLLTWSETMHERVAPNTWRQWDQHIRLYLVPKLGRYRLSRLRAADVNDMLAHLVTARPYRSSPDAASEYRPVDGQTRRHIRSTLRRALADALRAGAITSNAAALSDVPKLVTEERRILTLEEARALLAALRGERLYALFLVALHTGAREAELLGLRWTDLDGDTLHVRRTLQRVWTGELDEQGRRIHEWRMGQPKTERSRRDVTLTAPCLAALEAHRAEQARERGAYPLDGLIFTDSRGLPIHGSNLLPVLRRALKRANLPASVTVHDLRHSAATMLFALGVPLEVISDMLGHSTTRITADLYRHRVPQLQREAAAKLGEALG